MLFPKYKLGVNKSYYYNFFPFGYIYTHMYISQIIIDPVNHPVYVHCLDGRRITSLVVLLLRRLQGWTPQSAFSEYWRYQVSIKYPLAPNEVEKTTKEVETFASEISGIQLPDVLPK